MLGRDAVMWSDRIGLRGETNGSEDANSTAGATVFARAPMVRRMRQSCIISAADLAYVVLHHTLHVGILRVASTCTSSKVALYVRARIEKPAAGSSKLHYKAAKLLCSNELLFIAESLEYDGR